METPFIKIHEETMQRNIKKMNDLARNQGVSLRPHIKTHKIPEFAKRQIESGAAGITVAKVAEAEVMAENGINDIFIAYPLVTDTKIKRALQLSKHCQISVGVDSLYGAEKVSQLAQAANQVMNVKLEVDVGLKRTGMKYGQAVELSRKMNQLSHINITGIYTFKGAIFEGTPTKDLERAGREEGELMNKLALALNNEGINIQEVSVGSTPTVQSVSGSPGIHEVRPGTYIFYDRMQEAFGVCTWEDCAASVVVTVVSAPSDDLLVVDGGSKTFATDIQPNTPPLYMKGFGYIKNHPDAILERMTEEHGMINITPGHNVQIGDQLEIIPNHICSTVNLHNEVYLQTKEGDYQKKSVMARGRLQ